MVDARKHLQDWANFVGADPVVFSTAKSGDSLSVTRETIRLGILAAQRNLFGVIFWYLVLPGPLGPIIYRVSVQAMKEWNDYTNNQQNLSDQENSTKKTEDPSNTKKTTADPIDSDNLRDIPDFFGEISKKGFFWVDWVSSRTTAFIFAIVGNFEDAIQMIRARSAMVSKQGYDSERIILSAGEGAMTLRLTIPVATSGFEDFENIRSTDYIVPDLREVDENSMRILTGLIWRALFLWFFVLMLITLGYLSNVLT
ncbi:MAG: hypothetical protein CBD16_04365 [Betaproteobacteria bacterium TMED156]|nr:MAG: hypothetical protein CBD16_04365 [Betaproteobacteria bacterium TMED156]